MNANAEANEQFAESTPSTAEFRSFDAAFYQHLVDDSPHASIVHVDGTVIYANRAATRMFGVSFEAAAGQSLMAFVHPDSRTEVVARTISHLTADPDLSPAELLLLRSDGSAFIAEIHSAPIMVDSQRAVHVICWDITARVKREAEVTQRADHDPLTGLLRREPFMARLCTAIEKSSMSGLLLVVVADMDGFKSVNDSYGHLAGDELLAVLGKRLVSAVRKTDTVARLGGDEFLALSEQLRDQYEVQEFITRIENALTDPVALSIGVTVQLGASIGVDTFQGPLAAPADQIATELLRAADLRALRNKPAAREARRATS